MTKRMLIDATHAEETRVVVLDGNRLEDFDVETSTKKQLKGNIYLAKVVRVEPSLQAAFVEYGGGRHGFLAFSEIHPDYYQIPVADRQRLIELQAEEAREEAEREETAEQEEAPTRAAEPAASAPYPEAPTVHAAGEAAAEPDAPEAPAPPPFFPVVAAAAEPLPAPAAHDAAPADAPQAEAAPEPPPLPAAGAAAAPEPAPQDAEPPRPAQAAAIEREERFGTVAEVDPAMAFIAADEAETEGAIAESPPPETIGGEGDGNDAADQAQARRSYRFLRNYRIQEVIKRRQIMLVQVVKEERGTKGAALTSYISLAGRYCVLMPNSPRGGGISRKITSAADRRRLKEITAELDVPGGMGLIVRTAGANRPKAEIKRDCEYLMRLWDDIRELTLRSVAPALIYEEASLIKRAIRDVYSRDIDEVTVDGEDGWRAAHDFMRMLMPAHAKKVQLWRGDGQSLFAKYQVEAQLDAMLVPSVQLRSGGYLVINQTEALVAIDVNSGRSTRERGIEETALRTNLEAADEVARQLRLRDLAGLIVIDFIDMEARKHNAMVERRMKEALKVDRARIQVGHISHFGLMEMSRQRLRPSLAETSFIVCPHCGGTGHVRSVESSAIHVLRAVEDEGAKGRAAAIRVQAAGAVALYLLNHKRDRLAEIEARYAMQVTFEPEESLVPPQCRIERLKPQVAEPARPAHLPVVPVAPALPAAEEEAAGEAEEAVEREPTEAAAAVAGSEAQAAAEDSERRRRRRRRRRGGRREAPAGEAVAGVPTGAEEEEAEAAEPAAAVAAAPTEAQLPLDLAQAEQPSVEEGEPGEEAAARGRRRGRRGGRRRTAGEAVAAPPPIPADAEQPAYAGPTPANPFGGTAFDIYDLMDQEAALVQEPPPEPAAEAPAMVPQRPEPLPEEPRAEAAPAVAEASAPAAVEPAPVEPAPVEPAPVEPAAVELAVVEPAPAEAAPEPPAPAVQPVVIGAGEAPAAERKRGWWRR